MERRFADAIDDHVEQLAFYFYRSDDPARGLVYLERAAERARAIEATERERELWSRARRLADRLGDADARARAASRLDELGGETDVSGPHAEP